MKKAIFAAAGIAAVASAHEVRSPLELGAHVGNLINVDICLGLDVKLPLGIDIDTDRCPRSPPSEGCTNVWHPPHHVHMDDCDNNDESEWHYVHPCNCKAPVPHTWGTSTVIQTSVHTITSCAADVTNCPARVTTIVVPATTTICPVAVTPTTLATLPATGVAVPPYHNRLPPVSQTAAVSQPAVPTGLPVVSVPAYQPPAAQTTPCTTAAQNAATVPALPASVPAGLAPPAAVYPVPPVGTGSPVVPIAGYNATTARPVVAGASTNGQKVGVAAVVGLAAALLI
ncbi:Uncharacterized protein TCAP_01119 [Tolypocladium capitatum]|uniref:Adhesin-like protein 2 n=1 Tax=Tolypocladium capitatum TaxID=45235 RepID=A0A2K3QN49_9HYPO|nr:Uncharacterized protein TCAP_01119 [Tolypocladium capitatum]